MFVFFTALALQMTMLTGPGLAQTTSSTTTLPTTTTTTSTTLPPPTTTSTTLPPTTTTTTVTTSTTTTTIPSSTTSTTIASPSPSASASPSSGTTSPPPTSGTSSGSGSGTSSGGATDPSIINNLDAIILGEATASFGGGRSTAKLLAILGKLNSTGIATEKQVLAGIPRVPVAGLSYWVDDWHAYRCCPKPHLHQGVDMMAARGTPLIALADGVISQKINDPVWSGLGLALTDRSGTRYFYAHLSAFAAGVYAGEKVHVGDVIGYVGNTGDAAGGPTHLHFEVHPYGGVAVPPKPYVDRWLDVAQTRAIKLVLKQTGKKVTNADLNLGFWKNRLFELAQQEIQAGRLLAVRQAAALAKATPHTDQQTLPYGLPVIGLALIAGALLLIDRRRLAGPVGEPEDEGASAESQTARLRRAVTAPLSSAAVSTERT